MATRSFFTFVNVDKDKPTFTTDHDSKLSDHLPSSIREKLCQTRHRSTLMKHKDTLRQATGSAAADATTRAWAAHFRRNIYQNAHRNKWDRIPKISNQTILTSATTIQRSWRESRVHGVKKTARDLLRAGALTSSSYDQMQALLMAPSTIGLAVATVRAIVANDPTCTTKMDRKDGRKLLMALLISRYSSHLFVEPSEDELRLIGLAKSFSHQFERLITEPANRSTVSTLCESWMDWSHGFRLWQAADQPQLTAHLIEEYCNLESILTHSQEESTKQEWLPHIQKHQERIRKAIARVAGEPGLAALKSALEKLVRIEESSEDVAATNNLEPATITENESDTRTSDLFKTAFDNVHIAHELMVDPHFDFDRLMKLKGSPPQEDANSVGDHDYTPEDFVRFVLMAKEQLKDLALSHTHLVEQIDEHLQEDFLSQQAMSNSLNMIGTLQYIVEVMAKMCAPLRDEAIAGIKQALESHSYEHISDVCRQIVGILRDMHKDTINFGLRTIRGRVAQIIVKYEREWLAKTVLMVSTKNTEAIVKEMATQGLNTSVIIRNLLLQLLGLGDQGKSINVEDIELWTLDHSRIKRLALVLDKILLVSSILLVARNAKHPSTDQLSRRLKCLVMDHDDIDEESIKEELIHGVDSEDTKTILANSLQRNLRKDDPIVVLLRTRISSLLRSSLSEAKLESVIKSAAELTRHGLAGVIVDYYNSTIKEIVIMFRLHEEVLHPVYTSLLKQQ